LLQKRLIKKTAIGSPAAVARRSSQARLCANSASATKIGKRKSASRTSPSRTGSQTNTAKERASHTA
jgi:hypothetical protein